MFDYVRLIGFAYVCVFRRCPRVLNSLRFALLLLTYIANRFRYTTALKDAFSSSGISGLQNLDSNGMDVHSTAHLVADLTHIRTFARLGFWLGSQRFCRQP